MQSTLITSTTLLEGLHDHANHEAWRGFDQRYRPIIVGFARKLGLSDADAADVAQETLLRFLKDYEAGKYDRSRGRLRSWLVGIARYRVADMRRARAARREARGESAIAVLPDENTLSVMWDAECRRAILDRAFDDLRHTTRATDRTLRAFDMLVREQRKPAEVAAELGLSTNDVYVAKHRMLDQLRRRVTHWTAAYEVESTE